MATLSAGNLTNLRSAAMQASDLRMCVLKPATLLTAKVNNGSIARGARSIAYDNGSTPNGSTSFNCIEAGQPLYVVTTTGTRVARVKSITGTITSGTITVGENDIVWADNQDFTIKFDYPIFAIPPAIRSNVFYKDYDVSYAGQNLTPTPVALLGGHIAVDYAAGMTITFAEGGYAIASGASISSYNFSLKKSDGTVVTMTDGGTTWSGTIPSAGQYWVAESVTDSNSKTQTTRRCVFVVDPTNFPAYTDFTISSLSGSWQSGGWRVTIQATGAVTAADFPDGTIAVIYSKNYYAGAEAYVDLWGDASTNYTRRVLFAGYIRGDSDSDNASEATTEISFDLTTPEALLDNMTDFGSVTVKAVSGTPATWYEYASWLTVGRAIHHELKWHTTLLDVCDVYGLTTNTDGISYADFTDNSILQRCNSISYSRGHFAKLVSDRLGRLHLDTDSQMLNTTSRAALDTVFTIGATDIIPTVDVLYKPEQTTAAVDLDGVKFDGSTVTPYLSMAGGYVESTVSYGMPTFRGQGVRPIKSQVVTSQLDANEKAGRALAMDNNPLPELRLQMAGNYTGAFDIVPKIGWYVWGIANSALQRQLSLYNNKYVCRSVTAKTSGNNDAVLTDVILEMEALGPDGVQGNYPIGYPTPVVTTPPTPVSSYSYALLFYIYGTTLKVASVNTTTKAVSAGETVKTGVGAGVCWTGIQLSSTSGIAVYNTGAGTELCGKTITISSTGGLTIGSENTFGHNANAVGMCTAKVSSSAALLGFRTTGVGLQYVILSVSGSTITFNADLLVDANASNGIGGCAILDSTHAIVSWSGNDGDSYIKAEVLSISGTTLTNNTPATIASSFYDLEPWSDICALDATNAVVAYDYPIIATWTCYVRTISVSGTTITLGTEYTALANNQDTLTAAKHIVPVTTADFVLLSDYVDAYRPTLIAGTAAHPSISLGSAINLLGAASGSETNPSICVIDTATVYCAYKNSSVISRQSITVTGNALTASGDETTNGEAFDDSLITFSS